MTKEEAIKKLLRIRKHYQYIIPCEETIAIDMAIEALSDETPTDTISRADAIKAVAHEYGGKRIRSVGETVADILQSLEELPSAEAEDRLYIKIYADDEPSAKAEKLYQICGETQNREVTEWLKDYFPSADPKTGDWTPCSEGLPKAEYGESDCVWTTCCWKSDTATRWIEKLYFNGGNWCYPTGECFTHKVIAWMPLPKPWKGGDSE